MAKTQSIKAGSKHKLILYRFTTARFRPPGVLLILMGILAQLPSVVPQLRFGSAILNYQQLSLLGIVSIALGLFLYMGAVLAGRLAYVQCQPDLLLINTIFHRVYVSYKRINTVQPVQVGRMFDVASMKKARDKNLIKPLGGETALEVVLKEYPLPEKKLRKMFNRFMFSTRGDGFVLMVPKPSALSFEIETFSQKAVDKGNEDEQRYLDPIERLKYQDNKTF
jgi:hypothetical protein